MTPPSVLGLVSYRIFPAQMGGQKCVADFYAHLSERTNVTLAVARENTVVTGIPYPVLPFLYNHWWGFCNIIYLFKLRKLIREKNIDVLILEQSYFGWLGLLLKRITKKPLVIRSHNIETHRFRDLQRPWWRLYEWYEKKIHRKADHSFFITEEDLQWAIAHWQLDEKKCSVLTYGTEILHPSLNEEKKKYRDQLIASHSLDPSMRLFFFNGTLDYLPNTDALRIIISELLPLLLSVNFPFRIFITGNRLNEQWQEVLKGYPEIIYKGFVDNMDLYYKGADCFINPVTLGSGIKTKLVEALAHNQTAISTKSGARGITGDIIGRKLLLVEDYDWYSFAAAMIKLDIAAAGDTPHIFYQTFNWDTIIQKALLSLPANE